MKKISYVGMFSLFVISLFVCKTFLIDNNEEKVTKEVLYNDEGLFISVNGVSSNTLPTNGTYYLVDYDCKNANTKLSWDIENNKLFVTNNNKESGVSCYLEFKSNPSLSEMPVGSYVEYTGVGGNVGNTAVQCKKNGSASSSTATADTEAPNSCLGQNARDDLDDNGNTYGYCYSDDQKFYSKGWRIAYIGSHNKPVLVSGGSPECVSRTASSANGTHIKKLNSLALKYCNSDYVDGDCSCLDSNSDGYCDCTDSDNDGLCDEIENGTVDAWAISDFDFYNMTKGINGTGKRLTSGSSNLGDSGGILNGTLFCKSNFSVKECGYYYELLDNGGFYWFAARDSAASTYGVMWMPLDVRVITASDYLLSFGLRPMISLSSTVVVTGGKGTMDNPYTIANNSVEVTTVNTMDDSGNVNYVLSLMAAPNVEKMCVNVNSSGCSNYVEYTDTYSLDSFILKEGENMVYVYFKDSNNSIVATLNKSFNYE